MSENTPISGLAKRLVRDSLVAQDVAEQATKAANEKKIPFITQLVQSNAVAPRDIALAAADEFGSPLVDLDSIASDAIPTELVNEKLIRKHRALPLFKRGTRLFLAICDPTNLPALDEIKFNTGLNTEAVVVEEDKLDAAIETYLESQDTTLQDMGDADLDDLDIEAGEDEKAADTTTDVADDAPIVRFVNKILLDAIKLGASDIHFEPYEKSYRIRLRADGILQEVATPPVNLAGKLAARLKVMSRLDISERRIPQDGRIKLKLSKSRAIDFRVNTLPTLFGEKIVLRILDPDSAKLGIDMLGYEPNQKQLYMDALEQPQGMILVTGPTGSGKTVSLYTGLNILNTPERNISTAEDPAEINLEGINQVNVNTKVGLDFSSALRAFLRQDPDIVMVGEIRDLETANIAIKAAQTGHLVLSTLHTNSAPETLTRLRNMGVPAFNIATSVSLIIAQRLARRLCGHCKEPMNIPNEVLLEEGFKESDIGSFKVYGPKGCDKCNSGYKGRVGIYEVVKVTDKLSRIIMEDGNSIEIADAARKEGFNDLRTSGLLKVMQGVTSLEEVNRVTTGH
ncbi:MAG: type IV-A pilus assembly ATPase PilB [Pseudomonadales bacterium]|nr:type IV-A pilus assembly ATPase PilB [Pseudomonadales bacterium]